MKRRLGSDQVDTLLRRYTAGVSAHAISQEFGVGAASVMRLVRGHGLTVHERGLSPDTIEQATALYYSGCSVQKVADQLNVPKSTLLKALKRTNVMMRQPRRSSS